MIVAAQPQSSNRNLEKPPPLSRVHFYRKFRFTSPPSFPPRVSIATTSWLVEGFFPDAGLGMTIEREPTQSVPFPFLPFFPRELPPGQDVPLHASPLPAFLPSSFHNGRFDVGAAAGRGGGGSVVTGRCAEEAAPEEGREGVAGGPRPLSLGGPSRGRRTPLPPPPPPVKAPLGLLPLRRGRRALSSALAASTHPQPPPAAAWSSGPGDAAGLLVRGGVCAPPLPSPCSPLPPQVGGRAGGRVRGLCTCFGV